MLHENIINSEEYFEIVLSDMLTGMTEEEVIIFKLRYLHGYDLDYIAKRLGISIATVKRRAKSIKNIVKVNTSVSAFVLLIILSLLAESAGFL
jgi:RNA polymerase sigma factor (sigma-70 family)